MCVISELERVRGVIVGKPAVKHIEVVRHTCPHRSCHSEFVKVCSYSLENTPMSAVKAGM